MVKQVPVAFRNRRGLTLRGTLYVPERYTAALIYAHGFPTDSTGSAKRVCTTLSRAGILCLRFDFTGCGKSDGKHEERLMSRDLQDVRAAIDWLCAHAEFDKLVLLGHSTGAIDGALYARTDKRLDGVILSGVVSHLDEAVHIDFTDRQVRDFWTRGYTYTSHPTRWSGKRERIAKAFYDEYFTLDIPRTIRKYRGPLLIVHGEKDEAIPASEARELSALAGTTKSRKRLVIVKGADHGYHRNAAAYYRALLAFIRRVPTHTSGRARR